MTTKADLQREKLEAEAAENDHRLTCDGCEYYDEKRDRCTLMNPDSVGGFTPPGFTPTCYDCFLRKVKRA